jgi:hypothetical protein
MNDILRIKYPEFDVDEYKRLNPFLYFKKLKTKDEYIYNFLNEGRYKGRIYKESQQKKFSFHVLLATIGKITILNMLELLKKQLSEIDYLTIVFDGKNKSKNIEPIKSFCKDFICNVNIIVEEENLGYWGHGIRNKHKNLNGDFVFHIDDDDIIFDNTFDVIRKHCNDTDRIYIFKIILENNKIIWRKPEIELNYISTQSGIIPIEMNKNSNFELKYGGDFNFYKKLSDKYDMIFIDKIIYKKN